MCELHFFICIFQIVANDMRLEELSSLGIKEGLMVLRGIRRSMLTVFAGHHGVSFYHVTPFRVPESCLMHWKSILSIKIYLNKLLNTLAAANASVRLQFWDFPFSSLLNAALVHTVVVSFSFRRAALQPQPTEAEWKLCMSLPFTPGAMHAFTCQHFQHTHT